MDFNTILIQNNNIYKATKKRTLPKNIDYQHMVNSNQNKSSNPKTVNIDNDTFIHIDENDFKKSNETTTLSTTTTTSTILTSLKPKSTKKIKKEVPLITKVINIVNELLVYFSNLNNSRIFKVIPLSSQLNLKISKFEEVIEVLSILKIIKLNGIDSFEWVGKDNQEFKNLLCELQKSKINFVTGEFEILCEKCKQINISNNHNDNNHYNQIIKNNFKDYSRFNIEDITYQIIKLLVNTKSPNSTPCIPLDLICKNFNRNIHVDKQTFNILKDSRQIKLAQIVLKVLKALNLVYFKVINTNTIYYFDYSVPIKYCHF